ncbi:MAG: helix-turn-helix transcriptional regulator [Pegethrix bostrychoides GSE-TBD4-15B]|uniref:Helix-turn-helix transcriptional regulator n=1 Tax=Pegethrix bostrychoides GSE-TBD4-15B TaxID=2839662 RepID=A0A951PE79_9CYAN|nr:helix-turn-helix transcriptional regulator [Pegethrix bostrychoides GSE-TBD4-15B]
MLNPNLQLDLQPELQPKLEAKLDRDHCLEAQCPIQFVLDLLGNKWSILVLRELFGGDHRTHELLSALPGISTKTLTQRLRELEAYGLVERRIYAEIPPRVEYSLTSKGQQIQPVMAALHQVGSQWLEQDPCICPLNQVVTPSSGTTVIG